MLYDLDDGAWSDELCALLDIPRDALAESCPRAACSARCPSTSSPGSTARRSPASSATSRRRCSDSGARRPGWSRPPSGRAPSSSPTRARRAADDVDGLVTTVAWDLGERGGRAFALEGAAFVAGAALQWLRRRARPRDVVEAGGSARGLGRRRERRDLRPGAERPREPLVGPGGSGHAHGPLTGRHGAPTSLVRSWTRSASRGARCSTRCAPRSRGSASCASTGVQPRWTCCASRSRTARLVVRRPRSVEATAIGAATIAGCASACSASRSLPRRRVEEAAFTPGDATVADEAYGTWLDAVGAESGPCSGSGRAARDVAVDVGTPGQRGDLGHQLVGELRSASSPRRSAASRVSVFGSPKCTTTRRKSRGRRCPMGWTSVVPWIPTGITGTCAVEREPGDAGAAAVGAAVVGPRALGVQRDQAPVTEHLAGGLQGALGHRAAAAVDGDLPDGREEPARPPRVEVLRLREVRHAPADARGQEDRVAEALVVGREDGRTVGRAPTVARVPRSGSRRTGAA